MAGEAAPKPGSFAFYEAEGDTCFKNGALQRANEAYERALELRPQQVSVLLARSRVNIQLGRPDVALQDADKVLALNAKDYRGLYAKAEALFAAGDFEYALMFFHRGNHLRPDEEFRLGIQKAEQAISDSIAQQLLEGPGAQKKRLSETLRSSLSKSAASTVAANARALHSQSLGGSAGGGAAGSPAQSQAFSASQSQSQQQQQDADAALLAKTSPDKRQHRKLLGEMYADREFLESLAKDKHLRENEVSKIASSALKYLDTRTEFWRQQNPPNPDEPAAARPRGGAALRSSSSSKGGARAAHGGPVSRGLSALSGSQQLLDASVGASSSSPPPGAAASAGGRRGAGGAAAAAAGGAAYRKTSRQKYLEQTRYAIQTLENVNAAIDYGDPELGLKFAKGFLSRLATLEIPDKPRILGNLYSCMGITYMELGKLTLSAIHHRKDLDISVKYNYKDAYLRALGNLGQVYQRMGDYPQAIAMYEKKLIFGDEHEAAKLSESIGRCHLDAGDYENAAQFAERAVKAAQAVNDKAQLMSAYLLHGQALSQSGAHADAVASYERTLDLARELGDVAAQANALTHMGQAYLQLNEVQRSIQLQQQALELSAQLNQDDSHKAGAGAREAAAAQS